jgi:hypothetical protein
VNLAPSRLGWPALQEESPFGLRRRFERKVSQCEEIWLAGIAVFCRGFVGDGEHVAALQVDVLVEER